MTRGIQCLRSHELGPNEEKYERNGCRYMLGGRKNIFIDYRDRRTDHKCDTLDHLIYKHVIEMRKNVLKMVTIMVLAARDMIRMITHKVENFRNMMMLMESVVICTIL